MTYHVNQQKQENETPKEQKKRKIRNRMVYNDWGLYSFVQMLTYKCLLYGKELHIIDERDTTKTCHRCGHLQKMPLWKRVYRCENCGLVMDRDDNSAVNIYQRFLAWLGAHMERISMRCADVFTAIEDVNTFRKAATMTTYTHISVERSFQDKIATVTMRRPEVHNALNAQLITDLQAAFTDLSTDERLHAVVLTGEGRSFSTGADINMMAESATLDEERNIQDALRLADAFDSINNFPCPVVARVNGAAMGGGLGLISVCDIVIAAESARFAFSEVRLGIAPAVISPYVIRKIGETNARVLFVTGERFSPARAREIGLVHSVVPLEALDDAVGKALNELLQGGPHAIRTCKALALNVGHMDYDTARQYTAKTIAALRVSEEGQEGLRSFLEKRKPGWVS